MAEEVPYDVRSDLGTAFELPPLLQVPLSFPFNSSPDQVHQHSSHSTLSSTPLLANTCFPPPLQAVCRFVRGRGVSRQVRRHQLCRVRGYVQPRSSVFHQLRHSRLAHVPHAHTVPHQRRERPRRTAQSRSTLHARSLLQHMIFALTKRQISHSSTYCILERIFVRPAWVELSGSEDMVDVGCTTSIAAEVSHTHNEDRPHSSSPSRP